jgi:uncharacterized secreted protein with C-terminal beta-propeller domain
MMASGLPPGVYGTGSTAGTAIAYSDFRKLAWALQVGSVGSANATMNLLIQMASASAGTYSTWLSTGVLNGSVVSNQTYILDTRGEALYSAMGGQAYTVPLWVKANISISNSSVTCGLLALGYNHQYAPASTYTTASYSAGETDAY